MQSLPALLRALKKHGGNHEIIVVIDHESGDGTEQYVRTEFPEIKVIVAARSLFFGAATRLGVRTATRDVVVLMNNDTVVQEDFMEELIRPFTQADVFGVASRVCDDSTHHGESGKTRANFQSGRILWMHEPVTPNDLARKFCEVSWLHRGAFAFDRRKYHCLGGFDHIFDPLYFEDADLSFRAWKLGWKCLLAANSRISHVHNLQVPHAGQNFLHTILQRNAYLFVWKNVTDLRLLAWHFGAGTWRRFRRANTTTSINIEWRALRGAAKRLPRILRQRIRIARMTADRGRAFVGSTLKPETREKVAREVT